MSSCEDEKGATLVTLNNEQEERHVTTMMEYLTSMPFWIGLNDQDKDGNHEWLDKGNSTYINWLKKGTENCVVATSGGWSSEKCTSYHSSVCEYKQGRKQFYAVMGIDSISENVKRLSLSLVFLERGTMPVIATFRLNILK